MLNAGKARDVLRCHVIDRLGGVQQRRKMRHENICQLLLQNVKLGFIHGGHLHFRRNDITVFAKTPVLYAGLDNDWATNGHALGR